MAVTECCEERPLPLPHVGPECPERQRRAVWKLSDYILLNTLYESTYSAVMEAECEASGQLVGLKVYRKAGLHPIQQAQIQREIRIHSSLSHPHLIAFYAAFEDNEFYCIVLEYASEGDLFTKFKQRQGPMSEVEAVSSVVLPMMRGVAYMHSRGIIHRDLKPENILIQHGMVLKLADLGLSLDVNAERPVTRAGTESYMAPEVMKNPRKQRQHDFKEAVDLEYSFKVDVWALAVVAYELLFGFTPFGRGAEATARGPSQELEFHDDVAVLSSEARDFLQKALRKCPKERWALVDLLNHPWLRICNSSRDLALDIDSLANALPPAPLPCESPSALTKMTDAATKAANNSGGCAEIAGRQSSGSLKPASFTDPKKQANRVVASKSTTSSSDCFRSDKTGKSSSLFSSTPEVGTSSPLLLEIPPTTTTTSSRKCTTSYRPKLITSARTASGADGHLGIDTSAKQGVSSSSRSGKGLGSRQSRTSIIDSPSSAPSPRSRSRASSKVLSKDTERSELFPERQRRVAVLQSVEAALQAVDEKKRRIRRRNTDVAAATTTATRSLRMGFTDTTTLNPGRDSRVSTSLPSLGVRPARMSAKALPRQRRKAAPLGGHDLPTCVVDATEAHRATVSYTLPDIR